MLQCWDVLMDDPLFGKEVGVSIYRYTGFFCWRMTKFGCWVAMSRSSARISLWDATGKKQKWLVGKVLSAKVRKVFAPAFLAVELREVGSGAGIEAARLA